MTQRELHAAARAWARDIGIPVGSRGRVPTMIVDAYLMRPGNQDSQPVDASAGANAPHSG